MLVIPLKTTNRYDIAAPLACWLDDSSNEESATTTTTTTTTATSEESSDAVGGGNAVGDITNGSSSSSSSTTTTTSLQTPPLSASIKQQSQQKPDFTSCECQADLQRLSLARLILSDAFATPNSHESAIYCSDVLPKAYEYHAMLAEFERRGFHHVPPLSAGRSSTAEEDGDADGGHEADGIRWSCAFQNSATTTSSLETQNIRYERCCILFNIAALESHLAKKERGDGDNKAALTKSMNKCYTAASILEYLRTSVIPPPSSSSSGPSSGSGSLDLMSAILSMCENVLLAQGQCCVYETAALRPRPMHKMLAKVAMGAAEIFDEALKKGAVEQHSSEKEDDEDSVYKGWCMYIQTMSLLYRARAEHHEAMSLKDKNKIARLRNAERMCQEALEVYKKFPLSFTKETKADDGLEGGEAAAAAATTTTSSSTTTDNDEPVLVEEDSDDYAISEAEEEEEEIWTDVDTIGPKVHNEIITLHQEIQQQLTEAEAQHDESEGEIPSASDLNPIRGQNMMKKKPALPKELTADPNTVVSPPLFRSVLNAQEAEAAILTFRTKLDGMVKNLDEIVKRESNHARSTLAKVNLPQALSAYNSTGAVSGDPATGGNRSNGGLPEELWKQVESIQDSNELQRLKQNLWELKDISDIARNMVAKLTMDLNQDVETHNAFVDKHPTFDGPNIMELQSPFRQSLEGCKGWLANAQTGDAVLLQNLETFETEPQYGLLQYERNQLDRLVPPQQDQHMHQHHMPFDAGILTRLLMEMSNMIKGRDTLLATMVSEAKKINIRAKLMEELARAPSPSSDVEEGESAGEEKGGGGDSGDASLAPSSRYDAIVEKALDSFGIFQRDIIENVERQPRLLENILAENETFTEALSQMENNTLTTPQGHKNIRMIEDAVNTVVKVKQQLVEGRNFYDVVMPRLEQLKNQVSELSVKLAVERYDFEDRAEAQRSRNEQEKEDAKVAAQFAAEDKERGADHDMASRQSTRDIEEDARVAAEMARSFTQEMQAQTDRKNFVPPSSPAPATDVVEPNSEVTGEGGNVQMSMTEAAAAAVAALGDLAESDDELEGGEGDVSAHISRETSQGSGGHNSPGQELLGNGDSSRSAAAAAEQSGNTSEDGEQTLQGYRGASFRNTRGPPVGSGRPGVQFVSNFELPPTRVDDEKLATLVGMDFDPEKVYAALKKYDNNVDQALEELLTGG